MQITYESMPYAYQSPATLCKVAKRAAGRPNMSENAKQVRFAGILMTCLACLGGA